MSNVDPHKREAPCPYLDPHGRPCGAVAGQRCMSPATRKITSTHTPRRAASNCLGRDPAAEVEAIPESQRAGLELFLRAGYAQRRGDLGAVGGKVISGSMLDALCRVGAAYRIGSGWSAAPFGSRMLEVMEGGG